MATTPTPKLTPMQLSAERGRTSIPNPFAYGEHRTAKELKQADIDIRNAANEANKEARDAFNARPEIMAAKAEKDKAAGDQRMIDNIPRTPGLSQSIPNPFAYGAKPSTPPTAAQMAAADQRMINNIPRVSPPKVSPPQVSPPKMKKGGSVSSASSRADGVAQRGKTRGKMC